MTKELLESAFTLGRAVGMLEDMLANCFDSETREKLEQRASVFREKFNQLCADTLKDLV